MVIKDMPRILNKVALYCAVFILYFFFGMVFAFDGAVIAFGAVHFCAAAVLLILGTVTWRKALKTVGAVMLASALGLLWSVTARCIYYYPSQRFIEEYGGSEHEFVLRIDRTDSYGDTYGNFDCSILSCDGRSTDSLFGVYPSLRLSCFGDDFAENGDVISLVGKVILPEVETASGFGEEKYLRSKHIFMICEHNGGMKLIEKGVPGIIDRLRDRLSENLTRFIGDDAGDRTAVARCMLLGDKSGVRKGIKEMFRAAGISHVLSVSGLHLSILFMTVSVLLGLGKRNFRRRFVLAETVSCGLVFLYMMFADFTPSIMRAGFMLIFMNLYSAFMFYRRRFHNGKDMTEEGYTIGKGTFDSVSSLFCAGALIILISPYSLFDVGMQLSFMSTLGILVALPVFGMLEDRKVNAVLRGILTSLIITLAAVSFTLPICIYNFGTLSTVSFISNLLVTPVMTPTLALLLILALVSLLPWAGVVVSVCAFLGDICNALCGFCIWVADRLGSFTFSVIPARESIVLVVFFIAYVIFTVGCVFLGRRKLRDVGCLTLMCMYFVYSGISFMYFLFEFNNIGVNYCTVGQRPYMCVMSGDDRIFFDDASGVASDSIIRRSLGVQHYDTDNVYVVLPSAFADIDSVMFNIRYLERNKDVEAVLVPSRELCTSVGADREAYAELVKGLSEDGFALDFYNSGFSVGKADFKVAADKRGVNVLFEDVSVVFAEAYDEAYASKASEGMRKCIYFCRGAEETANFGYTSGAELFVSSHVHKKVGGASAIPVRRPALLER
ncbi:MAG: ComEC/Rec2 family competence protein [Ruminococcaceae bacterium]|nr:ComEC/Rec2 family competence protein [Oscillospiraceae bacterium]